MRGPWLQFLKQKNRKERQIELLEKQTHFVKDHKSIYLAIMKFADLITKQFQI
jgi:hypothetical protein